ncbi:MAG: hypothetical protein QM489_01100 [Candidatus Izemoplasma sp.]
MTAIFRNETRGSTARGYVDQYQQDTNSFISNRLYCAIADTRLLDLSGDVLDVDDYSASHLPGNDELSFWHDPVTGVAGAEIIGIQKVDENGIALVVPRDTNNWANAVAYTIGDYVVAENGTGQIDLFLCVSAGTSTTQPEYTAGLTTDTIYFDDTTDSIIADGGSLKWKYLFRLPSVMKDTLSDDEWVPVPYKGSIAVDSGNGDVDNSRSDAATILNAHHVLQKIVLLSDAGGVNLPNSGSYNRIAFIKNPVLADGVTFATATSYLAPLLSNDGANPYPSGEMVYLSHRGPITRQPNQTEDVKIVLAL